ncbi:hypothetical protein NUM3379_28700 [Kineococcus sp. NUM-3379]
MHFSPQTGDKVVDNLVQNRGQPGGRAVHTHRARGGRLCTAISPSTGLWTPAVRAPQALHRPRYLLQASDLHEHLSVHSLHKGYDDDGSPLWMFRQPT